MRNKISDLLDAYSDPNIDLERRTPLSPERIKELTMRKINEETMSKNRHITFRLLMTAAILVTMVVAVFAAGIGTTWFQAFFLNEYGTGLSEEQIAFIEENAFPVNQSKIVDGYRLNVESVMNDERIVYIKLDLYAPEGRVLPYGESRRFETAALYNAEGKPVNHGWSMGETIDEDKTDNHVEILISFHIEENRGPGFLLSDGNATLELTNLYKTYGAYFSRKTETIAEGTWQFELQFATTQEDLWECELISDPVPCRMVKDFTGEETEIIFTSVCLRALTIDVVYGYPDGRDLEPLYWRDIKVIKKDGTAVNVMPTDGSIHPTDTQVTGYMSFVTEVPIVLDEVAYIEFPGGMQIPVAVEG